MIGQPDVEGKPQVNINWHNLPAKRRRVGWQPAYCQHHWQLPSSGRCWRWCASRRILLGRSQEQFVVIFLAAALLRHQEDDAVFHQFFFCSRASGGVDIRLCRGQRDVLAPEPDDLEVW